MTDVRQRFITTRRPYTEGAVEVFEQPLQGKGAVKATLTITALGVYEAEIDGQKVGDILFAPGYTYYPRELQVQTYDVTALLKDESVLRVYLGQGWYCGRFTCDNKTQIYGERPAVAWALTVERARRPAEVFSSTDPAVMARSQPLWLRRILRWGGLLRRRRGPGGAAGGVSPCPLGGRSARGF